MISQWVSPGVRRPLGRAGVFVGAALWFLLSGSPASHADEGGLLDDTAHIVEAGVEQAVEPVMQIAEPTVQQPVEQVVEPTVRQTVEPAVPAAEQTVEPVVRVVEQAVRQAVEPVVKVVEPVVESAPVPVAPQVPIVGSPNGSHTNDVSDQYGSAHVDAGANGPAQERRPSETADRTYFADLAPRTMGGPGMLRHSGDGDDQGADQALWTLTNALMHLYAGDQVPGAIDAGLADAIARARTPWTAPLLLGLLLGFLSLVLARRRLAPG